MMCVWAFGAIMETKLGRYVAMHHVRWKDVYSCKQVLQREKCPRHQSIYQEFQHAPEQIVVQRRWKYNVLSWVDVLHVEMWFL